jgi:hypothetical protein
VNIYLVLSEINDFQPEHVASTRDLAEAWIAEQLADPHRQVGAGGTIREHFLVIEAPVDGEMPNW